MITSNIGGLGNSRLARLVARIMQSVFEEKRQAEIATKHAQARAERGVAELRLLCDDLKSMGIDVETPTGKHVLAHVIRTHMIERALADDEADVSEIGRDWPERM